VKTEGNAKHLREEGGDAPFQRSLVRNLRGLCRGGGQLEKRKKGNLNEKE